MTYVHIRKPSGELVTLDFDPSKCSTVEQAAKGFHKALSSFAESIGCPASYVAIYNPKEEAEHYGSQAQKTWRVSWEDGPYQWATECHFDICGVWGYAEPVYSFDLIFEGE